MGVDCSKRFYRRPRSRDGGFTLIEVLVAMTLLALAFVSLIGLSNSNIRLARATYDMTIASMMARDRLEHLLLIDRGFEAIGEESTVFLKEQYPGYEIVETADPMLDLPFEPPEGVEIKRYVVTVTWNTGDGLQTYTLENISAIFGDKANSQ